MLAALCRRDVATFVILALVVCVWTGLNAASTVLEPGRYPVAHAYRSKPVAMLLSVPIGVGILLCALAVHRYARRSLLCFLGFAVWFLVLALAFMPGCLNSDVVYTNWMVVRGVWAGWYSALHPALLTAFQQLYPSPNAPILALALICALLYTAMALSLLRMLAKPWVVVLLLLVSLTPAGLLMSTTVVRDSFFTAFLLLFALLIAELVRNAQFASPKTAVLIALLGGICVAYRSDALPSVVLGLALLTVKLRATQTTRTPRQTMALSIAPAIGAVVLIALIPFLLRGAWEDRAENEYKLTLMANPLGYILRQPDSHYTIDEKATIEKVFLFDDLIAEWSPQNISAFYGEHWNKSSSSAERGAAFRASMVIFARNPGAFLEGRWQTLKSVGQLPYATCMRPALSERGYPATINSGPLVNLGDTLRGALVDSQQPQGKWGVAPVWWNVTTWSALLVLVLISAKWAPAAATFAGLLLVRFVVVFLAAPAGFATYYLTQLIGAGFAVLLCLAELRWRKAGRPSGPASAQRPDRMRP
ncbi:hypothetical protein [Cupriavidus necator]|nr:hypothetical protein [Cupriavidus necator]